MPAPSDAEVPLDALIRLYLAVVHRETGQREPHERQAAVELCQQWAPDVDRAEIEARVDTAYVAVRSGVGAGPEVLAEELSTALSAELRRRLVRDLGLMARADGHLTLEEARRIGAIRAALARPLD